MDIGRYSLAQQLSGGRYGARWRATAVDEGEVVLKELALADGAGRDAVVQSAAAAARLSNPHLARVYEPVVDEDRVWLVEEWVPGASLAAVTEEHTLSPRQALGVARGALEGLAEAHRQGVIHGSLSPKTVMITLAGEAKLIELGSWVGQPEVAGLDGFASPEAVSGRPLSSAADVFSAGAMLRELLASDSAAGSAGPSGPLAGVLNRATDADPAARHADAAALLADLSSAAERSFGSLWWTVEGLGALSAATVTTASAAAGTSTAGLTGATATPGSGAAALAGSMSLSGAATMAGAALTDPGKAVVTGAIKVSRSTIAKIGAGVIAIGVVVAGVALAVTNRNAPTAAEPAGNLGGTASVPPASAPTTPPPAPTPTPTPTPPAALGFTGTYVSKSTVIKSNTPLSSVGATAQETWKVKTTCKGEVCTSNVTRAGDPFTLTGKGTTFTYRGNDPGTCFNLDTRAATTGDIELKRARTFTVAATKNGVITKLVGTSSFRQLDPCPDQRGALSKVTFRVVITRKG